MPRRALMIITTRTDTALTDGAITGIIDMDHMIVHAITVVVATAIATISGRYTLTPAIADTSQHLATNKGVAGIGNLRLVEP